MSSLSYDNLLKLLTGIRDENKVHANTAERVGTALIELLQYLNDAPYLRKDQPDRTEYLLQMIAGALIGPYGQIKLNPDGSVSCQSLTVEGSAVFQELVFNRQNILEGDTYFTDRGTIEDVTFLGANQYRLLLRREHENDTVTFQPYDVLRCAMNNLDADGTYRTSWMRVNAVDTTANTVDVTLYEDEDVPGGVNYEPEVGANVVRWGNQVDTSRQQVFFVSSEDGRIVYYINQTSPAVGDENYGFVIGRLPDIKPVSDSGLVGEVGIYTKNILFDRSMAVTWVGDVKYVTIDLGEWTRTEAENGSYFFRVEKSGNSTVCTRIQVTLNGQVWQTHSSSLSEGTFTIADPPSLGDTNWVHVSGELNDVFYYTTSETDSLEEGGVGVGSDEPLWLTDQRFFLQEKVINEDTHVEEYNAYYYSALRPYMWRKSHRQVGEDASDFVIVEEPHIIGVYGQTGVNYYITSTYDHIALDQNETSKTFTDKYSFFTDNGGIRSAFTCYAVVRVRLKNGTYRYIFHRFYGTGTSDTDITVTEDDAAVEILCNSSGQDMENTYLMKKEIPIVKAAKGDPGERGAAGPISRVFQDELINGMTYYAGETIEDSAILYQDYVAIPCPDFGSSGIVVYRCTAKFTYTGPTIRISDKYKAIGNIETFMTEQVGTGHLFERVEVNAASAFFTNLIAQNAYIRMLTGSNFVITDNLGNILAGMGNRVDGNGDQYYLWSGGKDADNATFKVFANGTLDALRGTFSGFVTSKETIITGKNVLDYVEDGINPHSGERTYAFDMDKVGAAIAFYQEIHGVKFDGTDLSMYPVGYGEITDLMDSTQVGEDIYFNLPYDIGGITSNYRSVFVDRFSVDASANDGGLGLYRYYLAKAADNRIDVSEAVSKQASDIPSSVDDKWWLYPYEYVAMLGKKARQLVGSKIVIRLYGQPYSGLKFSGICFENGNANDLYETYTFDELKVKLGLNQLVYGMSNLLTLECRLFGHLDANYNVDYTYIGWVPTFSFLGYYDRYTIGLPDISE